MKEQFLARLKATQNEDEWNAICDEVKVYTKTLSEDERSGDYPKWWYSEVIASGLTRSKKFY